MSRFDRKLAAAVVVLAPFAALVWMGCSDDEGVTGYGPIYVDPGGTFGAELAVNVVGRGRVVTGALDVDCPGSCFGKYIFDNAQAKGADGKLTLKASPTPGSRFGGWSFDTAPSGTKGRGGVSCNPVTRAGSDPAVDKNALEIQLPFGEIAGAPPAGAEGKCVGTTNVPLVYNVTATFITDPPPPDPPDAGGPLEIAYNAPIIGASGREVGITQSNYLYWHFQAGGLSGIAYDSNPYSTAPQTASVIVSPSTVFTLFEVDPYGVAYQDISGNVSFIRNGLTSPTAMGTAPGSSCTALAVDSSYNVYCRTSSSLIQWMYPSYTTGTVLYTGLPNGNDLVVESSGGSAYFSNATSLLSLPVTGTDGGTASPTTVIASSFGSSNTEPNASRFFWIDSNGNVRASSSKTTSPVVYDTSVPVSASYKFLAQDPNSSGSHFWVASSTSLYHAYYFGGTTAGATEPIRTNLSGVNGMTADSSYVYLSMADGTIRRISASSISQL